MAPLTPEAAVRNREYQRKWRQTPAGRDWAKRAQARRQERNRADPDRRRNAKFMFRYGITLDDYNSMLEAQGGVCAVCKQSGHTKQRLHVDHNHESGQVRSLLCALCNAALGALKEDLDLIESLAQYVRMWNP